MKVYKNNRILSLRDTIAKEFSISVFKRTIEK